jgi:hypothetical protein
MSVGNRRLREPDRAEVVGAGKKKVCKSFTKNRIRATSFVLAELSVAFLQCERAASEKDRKNGFEAFWHNLRRELQRAGNFFIRIGCNPLKSPDSEK